MSGSIRMPLLPLLIAYMSGLLLSRHLSCSVHIISISAAILLGALAVSIMKQWRKTSTCLSFAVFFLLGCLLMNMSLHPHLPSNHISRLITGKKMNVEGNIYLLSKGYLDLTKIYLDAKRIYTDGKVIPVCGKVLIRAKELQDHFSYGDRIRFFALLRHPRNFGNPGEFDYEKYLGMRKIWVTGYLNDGKGVVKISEGNGNPLFLLIESIKKKVDTLIEQQVSLTARGILKALILGERGEISPELKEDFIKSGAAHILAISGLHIGIVAFIFFFLIRKTLLLSERLTLFFNVNKIAAVTTIFPVVSYTLIAGLRISTVRAAIMVITYLVAIIIDREREIYNTVILSAFIILIVLPLSLFDASFQLSFISVLAILYLTAKLWDFKKKEDLPEKAPTFFSKPAKKTALFVLVSLSAVIGTTPLLAYYFNRVSLAALFTNLFVVPIFGFIIVPLGLLSCLLLFLYPPIAEILIKSDSFIIDLINPVIHLFASLSALSFRVATPTLFEIFLFYSFVITIVNFKKKGWAQFGFYLILLLMVINYSCHIIAKNFSSQLKVTFISVGQGESTLLELPGGKTMLIDGGGFYTKNFDVGKNVVAPLLWKRKIRKIDYLVLSHPQIDHLGGLPFILKNFRVMEVWSNQDTSNAKAYLEFISLIKEKKINMVIKDRGSSPLIVNGVGFEFLNPPHSPTGRFLDLNNNSLVIKLSFKEISFLFTGDIETKAEALLAAQGNNLKSVVIKVPHHGSITSSTKNFLKKIKPVLSVFSVGYSNRRGFPHKEVVGRYEKMGCRIFRTDRDGAITMVVDGNRIKIKKYR